jgi:hypothetical protein
MLPASWRISTSSYIHALHLRYALPPCLNIHIILGDTGYQYAKVLIGIVQRWLRSSPWRI